jgi:serine/threonine protein kinase
LGILFLGEKKSEQPYSNSDKKLLEAIAGQMAVVQENALLKSRVDRERKIKHDVLARLADDLVNIVHECPHCGACYDATTKTCAVDGYDVQVSLPVERTIEGKYRLERLIGKGGMGAVYEATDLRLDRQVAIKVMLGGMFGDQDSLSRFEREARASARLNHPNIITVYDYGRTGAEGAFLVMELVRGFTLRRELLRTGTIEPAKAAAWLDQLLDGIQAAHRAGVVHRDLKPENVLVTQTEKGTDFVKILDFGIAKFTLAERTDLGKLTTPGVLLGTLGYMSPEQLEGKTVDRRADVFSLGVIVVEILTGRRPFEAPTYMELLSQLMKTHYHLPGDDPKVLELDRILQRCLAIDPAARFESVDELQKALVPAVRDCPPFPNNREPIGEAETLVHS